MYIGVDLLWVRPGICGGTESFIRNLLNGLAKYDTENQYVLFVAQDNADTFQHYEKFPHMHLEMSCLFRYTVSRELVEVFLMRL